MRSLNLSPSRPSPPSTHQPYTIPRKPRYIVGVGLVEAELGALWAVDDLLDGAVDRDDRNLLLAVERDREQFLALVLEEDDAVDVGLEDVVLANPGPRVAACSR